MNAIYNVILSQFDKLCFCEYDEKLRSGENVIVATDNGLQFGKIISIAEKTPTSFYKVLRKANEDDLKKYESNLEDANKAAIKCRQLVNDLGLEMHIINAKYSFDRKQLLFNFTADDRIDFRELARKLAGIYHTRIELHQMGIRDKAKEVGGLGICGQCLCCTRFLEKIEGISMNMAKNQNLALNPNKINGVCGRLLCCLAFEDENYLESSKGMPMVGEEIKTPLGKAVVESINIPKRSYKVRINDELKEFKIEENSKK